MATLFAMVTTRHSHRYTGHALASLVEHTRFNAGDHVVVIDNDGDYVPGAAGSSLVQVAVNRAPRSFAANLNAMLDRADGQRADLVFLNNDVIFSSGWFEPMRRLDDCLSSPLSNGEVPYDDPTFNCRLGMELEEYIGYERAFERIVRRHRKRAKGFYAVLSFPFFAVKIPRAVYSAVGQLDESFGTGGGEDKDYCIRCHLGGFEMKFALESYILHFQGKSTWRGPESPAETSARDRFFMNRFREKWGEALLQVMVLNKLDILPAHLVEAHDNGRYVELIEQLLPGNPVREEGLAQSGKRLAVPFLSR